MRMGRKGVQGGCEDEGVKLGKGRGKNVGISSNYSCKLELHALI